MSVRGIAALVVVCVALPGSARAVDPRCDDDPGTNPTLPQVAPLDASVVFVREDCCALPEALQPYCFDDRFATNGRVLDDLNRWIGWSNPAQGLPASQRRLPSAESPLTVDFGAGDFAGTLSCQDPALTEPTGVYGHTSFRGAGRSRTTLVAGDFDTAIEGAGCDALSFSDMTIRSPTYSQFDAILNFMRTNSTWNNVDIFGIWSEYPTCDRYVKRDAHGQSIGISNPARHVFTNSRFIVSRTNTVLGCYHAPSRQQPTDMREAVAYVSSCDVTEFYGGGIRVEVGADVIDGSPQTLVAAVVSVATGVFEAYGTKIEVVTTAGGTAALNPGLESGGAGLVALAADIETGLETGPSSLCMPVTDDPSLVPPGGTIELTGGSVVVNGSLITGQSATGAFASRNGTIVTNGTSFEVRSASGQPARRIAGSGRIHSPNFQANDGCGPFAATGAPGELESLDGQDVFLELGCNASGACGGGAGTQKHLMVYDSSCGSSNPWRDSVTAACRPATNSSAATADDDGDGVLNKDDNCVCVANPPVTPLAFQHTTGGQLDDDQDGFGNRCDADFDNDSFVDMRDQLEFAPSQGKARSASNCGAMGDRSCAVFDLDGVGTVISAGDLNAFRASGVSPGAKCPTCPLP